MGRHPGRDHQAVGCRTAPIGERRQVSRNTGKVSELNRLGGSVVRYFGVALLVPPLSGEIEMPYRGRRALTEARVVGIGSRSTRASRSDLIVAGASCYLVRNAK